LLSIPIVCLSEIFVKQQDLFYKRNGVEHKIERIYNRIVWDELEKQSGDIQEKGRLLLQPLNIEWVTHPNHFYRISKYLLPLLTSSFVPKAYFLSALKKIPTDLENYVLKPLFSYAGQGVIIDVKQADITGIQDPENWILQEKVEYASIIETPTGPAKAEIRLFYLLDQNTNQYIATLNLARISKGKMIGVSYNANATWVGGSIAYFEKN
jgi:glutathionylspermidine synthase